MSVKENILISLEKRRGSFISGEALAENLGVTRAAVHKGIASLKNQGHKIISVTGKGYALEDSSDVITESGIRHFLTVETNSPIYIFDQIDSTNTYAKQLINQNAKNATLVISDEQTAGRGRFGRNFFSKKGGLYMSIILKDFVKLENSVLVTIAAAVAVCKALETLTGEKSDIKWVNDVYFKGKKVCGILTEAVTNFETSSINGIVIGIGINISLEEKDMPKDIIDRAGSLKDFNILRNQLAALIADNILAMSKNFEDKEIMEYYKARSFLLGKEVIFIKQGKIFTATAKDITEKGGLEVLFNTGETEILLSGEVSVKEKK